MEKIDFKKTRKDLYLPSAKDFRIIDVPEMQFSTGRVGCFAQRTYAESLQSRHRSSRSGTPLIAVRTSVRRSSLQRNVGRCERNQPNQQARRSHQDADQHSIPGDGLTKQDDPSHNQGDWSDDGS